MFKRPVFKISVFYPLFAASLLFLAVFPCFAQVNSDPRFDDDLDKNMSSGNPIVPAVNPGTGQIPTPGYTFPTNLPEITPTKGIPYSSQPFGDNKDTSINWNRQTAPINIPTIVPVYNPLIVDSPESRGGLKWDPGSSHDVYYSGGFPVQSPAPTLIIIPGPGPTSNPIIANPPKVTGPIGIDPDYQLDFDTFNAFLQPGIYTVVIPNTGSQTFTITIIPQVGNQNFDLSSGAPNTFITFKYFSVDQPSPAQGLTPLWLPVTPLPNNPEANYNGLNESQYPQIGYDNFSGFPVEPLAPSSFIITRPIGPTNGFITVVSPAEIGGGNGYNDDPFDFSGTTPVSPFDNLIPSPVVPLGPMTPGSVYFDVPREYGGFEIDWDYSRNFDTSSGFPVEPMAVTPFLINNQTQPSVDDWVVTTPDITAGLTDYGLDTTAIPQLFAAENVYFIPDIETLDNSEALQPISVEPIGFFAVSDQAELFIFVTPDVETATDISWEVAGQELTGEQVEPVILETAAIEPIDLTVPEEPKAAEEIAVEEQKTADQESGVPEAQAQVQTRVVPEQSRIFDLSAFTESVKQKSAQLVQEVAKNSTAVIRVEVAKIRSAFNALTRKTVVWAKLAAKCISQVTQESNEKVVQFTKQAVKDLSVLIEQCKTGIKEIKAYFKNLKGQNKKTEAAWELPILKILFSAEKRDSKANDTVDTVILMDYLVNFNENRQPCDLPLSRENIRLESQKVYPDSVNKKNNGPGSGSILTRTQFTDYTRPINDNIIKNGLSPPCRSTILCSFALPFCLIFRIDLLCSIRLQARRRLDAFCLRFAFISSFLTFHNKNIGIFLPSGSIRFFAFYSQKTRIFQKREGSC